MVVGNRPEPQDPAPCSSGALADLPAQDYLAVDAGRHAYPEVWPLTQRRILIALSITARALRASA